MSTPALQATSAAQTALSKAQQLQKLDPTPAHAKAVQTALLNLQAIQKGMSPSTRQAVAGIDNLMHSFDRLAKAVQPLVFKVFNDGLKVANDLLPVLLPLARAAGGAIDGLLKRFDAFARSKGFQDWIRKFATLAGPAITAIGLGLGKVAIAVGKLITRFSGHDVARAINIFFDTIVGAIDGIEKAISGIMAAWDFMTKTLPKWTLGR